MPWDPAFVEMAGWQGAMKAHPRSSVMAEPRRQATFPAKTPPGGGRRWLDRYSLRRECAELAALVAARVPRKAPKLTMADRKNALPAISYRTWAIQAFDSIYDLPMLKKLLGQISSAPTAETNKT